MSSPLINSVSPVVKWVLQTNDQQWADVDTNTDSFDYFYLRLKINEKMKKWITIHHHLKSWISLSDEEPSIPRDDDSFNTDRILLRELWETSRVLRGLAAFWHISRTFLAFVQNSSRQDPRSPEIRIVRTGFRWFFTNRSRHPAIAPSIRLFRNSSPVHIKKCLL